MIHWGNNERPSRHFIVLATIDSLISAHGTTTKDQSDFKEDTVWDHLADTTSAPSAVGEHGQIAVKVIDSRGNELLVVKKLEK